MSNQLQSIVREQQKQQEQVSGQGDENFVDEYVQLVGFIVGNEEFAVPILSIQEIIKPMEYTRVPFVENYILGVFNLRGNVLPLIDLRKKFHIDADSVNFDSEVRFIVMKIGEELAGFVIDRLTEALRLREDSILPPPDSGNNREVFIEGIARKDDRIITILKLNSLLKRG